MGGRGNKKLLIILVVILILFMIMKSNYIRPTTGLNLTKQGLRDLPLDVHIVSFVNYMSRHGLIIALLPGIYKFSITYTPGTAAGASAAVPAKVIEIFMNYSKIVTATTNDTPSLTNSLYTLIEPSLVAVALQTGGTVPHDIPSATDTVVKAVDITTKGQMFEIGIMSDDGLHFNPISTGLIQNGTQPYYAYSLCDCYIFLDAMIESGTRYAIRRDSTDHTQYPYGKTSSNDPFSGFMPPPPARDQSKRTYYLSNPGITIATPDFRPIGDYACRYSSGEGTVYA
jgi:hypothetical protein